MCKQIDEYKNTVAVLQEDSEKLSHKDAEINMLNANILEQRTSIINLNEQLNAQHDDMQSKIDELTVSAGDIGTKYGELLDEHRDHHSCALHQSVTVVLLISCAPQANHYSND